MFLRWEQSSSEGSKRSEFWRKKRKKDVDENESDDEKQESHSF